MSAQNNSSSRPFAYELNFFPWNLRRVPASVKINGKIVPHPGRHCAIFVVHGMGEQQWTETASTLRSGFEDALDAIHAWQTKNLSQDKITTDQVPPPFTYDGYWANYVDIEKTFPEEWEKFDKGEKLFFSRLWTQRAYSKFRTVGWLLRQQVRLLFLPHITPMARLLYLPLQFLFPLVLIFALIRSPRMISRVLADVRLYAFPQGMSERAIIQRMEFRIGQEFLRMLGLDWNFRSLPHHQRVMSSGSPFVFDRVIWVAHSLGTIISYNVLSDLFHRAGEVEKSGDKDQKAGVKKFRSSLRRFVTLGSPLDKFALLFPEALRPWPKQDRANFLRTTGDTCVPTHRGDTIDESHDWWINFYHVLDPVSGALNNPYICHEKPPLNIESDWKSLALVPGLAHSSYWSALKVLRFILGRTYGKEYLLDEEMKISSPRKQRWSAVIGYIIWAFVLYGIIFLAFWFYKDILHLVWNLLKSYANIQS
jgi:hypothetical protein